MTDPIPGSPAAGSPGPGWWQASDGRWYPPQPPTDENPAPQRGFFTSALIVLGAFVAIIAFLIFVIAFLGAPAEDREQGRGPISVAAGD